MFPAEKVNVSPSLTTLLVVRAPCHNRFPPELASAIAMCVTVPKFPPLAVKLWAFVLVVVPPGEDAAANVTDCLE